MVLLYCAMATYLHTEVYLDGNYVMINQDVTETSMKCVLSAEKTEAVSEETIAIAESEEK